MSRTFLEVRIKDIEDRRVKDILHYSLQQDVPRFDLDELPSLNRTISDEDMNFFVETLKTNVDAILYIQNKNLSSCGMQIGR